MIESEAAAAAAAADDFYVNGTLDESQPTRTWQRSPAGHPAPSASGRRPTRPL